MNEDIREIFTRVLPDQEPAVGLSVQQLAESGRRKRRVRRIGYTGGGITAVVVAALLWGQIPAVEEQSAPTAEESTVDVGNFDACSPDTEESQVYSPMHACVQDEETRRLSEELRSVIKAAAPDVDFRGGDWDGAHEPFQLGWELVLATTEFYDDLVGAAIVGGNEDAEYVTVSLLPPGGWEDDLDFTIDRIDSYSFFSCASGDPEETPASVNPIESECTESTGPAGETVMTSYQEQLSDGRLILRQSTVLVLRDDGSAVRARSYCGIEPETDGAPCEPAVTMDMLVEITLNAPKVPQEKPREN